MRLPRPGRLHVAHAVCAMWLAASESVGAQDKPMSTQPEASYGATAIAQRLPSSAGDRTLRETDFSGRPRLRVMDLLSAVPGLYVVQHAGGGKANQYFLRGFDADHGTD